MLPFVMGVHASVHNRHLYMSVVKSLLYSRLSKRVICLLERKRIKQDRWICFTTFKPWSVSIRDFLQDLQGFLATSVNDEVATQYKVPAKLQDDKVASSQVFKPDSPIPSAGFFSSLLLCTMFFQ